MSADCLIGIVEVYLEAPNFYIIVNTTHRKGSTAKEGFYRMLLIQRKQYN